MGGKLACDVVVAGGSGLDDVGDAVAPSKPEDRRAHQIPAVVGLEGCVRQPEVQQLSLPRAELREVPGHGVTLVGTVPP